MEQLGLQSGVQLADLVQEDGAAVGELEAAGLRWWAPVKAPRSWPNSSLSSSSRGIAAQLTLTNAPAGGGECVVDGPGDHSLPTPVSPQTSTVTSARAACSITSLDLAHLGADQQGQLALQALALSSTGTAGAGSRRGRAEPRP